MSGGSLLTAALTAYAVKSASKSAKAPTPIAPSAPAAPASSPSETPDLELNAVETDAERLAKKRKGKSKYRVDKIKSSESAGLQSAGGGSPMANLKIK